MRRASAALVAIVLSLCGAAIFARSDAFVPRLASVAQGVAGQTKLPTPGACEKIEIGDPVREAVANVRKGDLRPFTVYGFTPGDAPGILCPDGDYRKLGTRGGTLVSDVPDACGSYSFSNADPAKMEAYNVALAGTREFQRATGCRTVTWCEKRYSKHGYAAREFAKLDPRCPNEPVILMSIAAYGTADELRTALGSFETKTPAGRDLLTRALLSAINRAAWDNAKILVAAGADVNGTMHSAKTPQRGRVSAPIAEVFNQNGDKAGKVAMARWLIAHGARLSAPGASDALRWAAFELDEAAVDLLLDSGASPNGHLTDTDFRMRNSGPINSAGGGYDYASTPFYEAIGQALLSRSRRTPKEAEWADGEEAKAKRIAVRLYTAGGRFIIGAVYNNMYRDPDTDVISILMAAAQREGRLPDLVGRLEELMPIYLEKPSDDSARQRRALHYVRAVKACPSIKPRPMVDHVKLCTTGPV